VDRSGFGVNVEALATDYDDTLAQFGRTDAPALRALQRVKQSGRKLILVTGRVLPDLKRVFPEIALFDLVVAENGALLYDPHRDEETVLAEPPPEDFVATLRNLCITPLEVGRTIVATREPNESIVLATIRDLGLEHHIIFNKGAVMVLPPNVNKAFGLGAALSRLGLLPQNVVGIGDAENDHAFLDACGCAVAVGNALPALKEKADLVVKPRGQGVVEVANLLLAGGLRRSQRVTPGTVSPEVGRGSAR
jgi:HAD superfamily hydrolase (TIGR01484 family)